MINNCKINIMGTVDFDGLFAGMRKPQNFSVYPMPDSSHETIVQSGTRIGRINFETGIVRLSKSHASGAYGGHLSSDTLTENKVPLEELETLKGWVRKSGGSLVGKDFIHCDNTGASAVI